jgi:putative ABC transport system permease protein
MAFIEILAVALGSIRANAFRAALTMLGVIIGVAAVITMVALGTGAQRAIDAQLAALGGNILTINTGMWFNRGVARDQPRLTIKDAAALGADARYLDAVVPEMDLREQIKLGNRNLNLGITGTTPNYAAVQGYELAVGRMFSAADDKARRRVMVLGGDVPGMFGTTAEAIIGRSLLVRAVPYEVIGVFREKGSIGPRNPDDDVWIPISTAQYRIVGDDLLQSISVEVTPGVLNEQALVDIERVLRKAHGIRPGRDNDFAIFDRKQFLSAQQQATEVFTFLLAGIATVSLVVGGIGIMNIMLVSVTERTREVGIRKALGASRSGILLQFLIEALLLTLLGGAIGVLLGAGLAMALARFAGWQTYVSASAVGIAFGFSAVVGLVFGIWPAYRAARMNPVEALRYE